MRTRGLGNLGYALQANFQFSKSLKWELRTKHSEKLKFTRDEPKKFIRVHPTGIH